MNWGGRPVPPSRAHDDRISVWGPRGSCIASVHCTATRFLRVRSAQLEGVQLATFVQEDLHVDIAAMERSLLRTQARMDKATLDVRRHADSLRSLSCGRGESLELIIGALRQRYEEAWQLHDEVLGIQARLTGRRQDARAVAHLLYVMMAKVCAPVTAEEAEEARDREDGGACAVDLAYPEFGEEDQGCLEWVSDYVRAWAVWSRRSQTEESERAAAAEGPGGVEAWEEARSDWVGPFCPPSREVRR